MKQTIKIFKALGDNNRLRIMKMLEKRSLCVCEITEVLQLATSTVSKHLSLLKDAELIVDKKDGKWVYFALNNKNEYVEDYLKILKKEVNEDERVIEDLKILESDTMKKFCEIKLKGE